MAKFIPSQKGSIKLEFDGHLYQKKRCRGTIIDWRCDQYKKGCKGSATTTGSDEGTDVKLGMEHNHAPSPGNLFLLLFLGQFFFEI